MPPLIKTGEFDWPEPGEDLYWAPRHSTGVFIDLADGVWKNPRPAAPFIELVEDIEGTGHYTFTDSRAVWPDGKVSGPIYKRLGSTRNEQVDQMVGSGVMSIEGDAEVQLIGYIVPDNEGIAVSREQITKILFDASGYVKSAPQTAVTVNPAQVLGGALQPLLPIKATATIEVPQGDVYPLPWAIGSAAAKADAKFLFQAGTISREITIADPATVSGMIVLTSLETATIASGPARVLRVDSDGTSNPLTVWKGKLNIVANVG